MLENRFRWPPKSVLPLKGRLDARKGLAAANTYVEKTRQRMAVLTAQEIMAVEKALQKTRQDASGRLAERNRTLERLAALPPVREEDSAAAIRANRRDADERNCLRAALVSCEEALISGHNSKKYQAALRLKKEIAENPDKFHLPETDYDCDREIDSFGETATTCVRQSQKRLTPEEVKLLIAEYQAGKTPTELSEKYGCHRITVGKILKRNGVEIRACLKTFDKNGGVGDNRKKQAGAGENASIPK